MFLSESKESRTQYTLWMKKKKDIKTRVTINSENARTELAKDIATLGSEAYTNFPRAKIHLLIETAIKWQTEFNQAFSEMLVMIEGVDCEENGAQWEEKQRYKAEVRSEWDKERDRLMQYRDYLTSTAEGLAGPISHTQTSRGNRQEADEHVVR